MRLSILICTLPERERYFRILLAQLQLQIQDFSQVEIEKDPRGRDVPTGIKRNDLMNKAHGDYLVFIDDDDKVPEYYVSEILKALESNPDCVTFKGYMTTNGERREDFRLSLGSAYETRPHPVTRNPVHYRWPNHITPIRTSIARQVQFPPVHFAEDYIWSKEINDRGLIKTEVHIDKDMYHYDLKTNKYNG